jgi:predicted Fe-Mo cluster-binding NifX family protein
MIICLPITKDGNVDPRWGRADWIAIADVVNHEILSWREVKVSWSTLHDQGTDGSHHARVVKFLKDQKIEAIVVNHMGDGMTRMLETMKIPVQLGAIGDARAAAQSFSTQR